MARIQLENVTKRFGKVTALDGGSLDITDKAVFVLFGPAGAGKTTILNCIAGIQLPEEGVVKFDGEVVNLVDAACPQVLNKPALEVVEQNRGRRKQQVQKYILVIRTEKGWCKRTVKYLYGLAW